MTAVILRGDARNLPLPDASVDLIVTSPPYFALRSYTDGGEHYAGQIGSEGTPAEYVAALLDCTREWVRVLKPSGSLFVNLGDKFAERAGPGHADRGDETVSFRAERPRRRQTPGIRPKSLMGLPWRYALGCIDDLGLILRAEIVWSKPNGLPESVSDRVRRSHEQWFHFTRLPRYFAAVDEIREPAAEAHRSRPGVVETDRARRDGQYQVNAMFSGQRERIYNPLGKLPGSVWDIPSEPLTVPDHLGIDHFAAFPSEWPKRIINGWSPTGICTACDEPRRPIVDKQLVDIWHDKPPVDSKFIDRDEAHMNGRKNQRDVMMRTFGRTSATITGYACGCDTPWPIGAVQPSTRPAVVLDPFGGTGTTALVADALGRIGISVDMSADYCRLAQWRTTNRAQIAKVLDLPKPPTEVIGQGDLFTTLEGFTA